MNYAVMPLADYDAVCNKVREKVDDKVVLFEDKGFDYLVSEPFLVEAGKTYTLNAEFSDSGSYSGFVITGVGWKGDTSPWISEVTLPYTFTGYDFLGCCVYLSTYKNLTANDIISASIECDGEIIADFVAPPKIKSGELAEKVDEVYWTAASDFGLKGKGQGEIVTLNNVHPTEHKVEVGLSSKNLFNEDTADITKVDDYFFSNKGYLQAPCFALKVESGATYTATVEYYTPNTVQFAQILAFSFSREKTYTNYENSIYIRLKTQDSTNGYVKDIKTFTIPDGVEEIYFIANNDETYFKNVMVEKNSTATAYAPFVADFADCKVKASGKNLVNILMPDYIPSNGFEVLDDNSIRVYANRGYTVGVKYNVKAPVGAKIVISFNSELGGEATGSYNLVHRNGGSSIIANGATTIMPANGEMQIEFARTGGGNDKKGWIDIKNLQVEIGTVPTEYEPYTETEYTATADGTVEGVKSISPVMNISTDKAGAVIDAECFLDPQAVITDLTNTVITLGGEI